MPEAAPVLADRFTFKGALVEVIDALELHVHPVGAVMDENVVLLGIASLNVAFKASSGPALVTTWL